MTDKMIQGGFNPQKLHTLCNFIDIDKTKKDNYDKADYYCYVGRLSHEKGVETLIKAALLLSYKLKIIGGGSLAEEVTKQTKDTNIEFVGYKQWNDIKEIVGKALFTIIPSEWYENNPLSVIESLSLGTPVLGSEVGGIPELMKTHKLNMTFQMGNISDLKEKINLMWNRVLSKKDYQELAISSQNRFSGEKYYNEIMKIYREQVNKGLK
jgi:glycosyltransferase involved in cell wall biosynthesis